MCNVCEHACMYVHIFTDVIAAIKSDDPNDTFNMKTFIHSNKPPSSVDTNYANESSYVFIDAKLSQFGQKGSLFAIMVINISVSYIATTYV